MKRTLTITGIVLVTLPLGISFVWPAKQKGAVTFQNLTQSLKITGFDRTGEVWKIHLRNEDPKRAVTAFTIHVGQGQFAFPDFAMSGGSIPPGGTFDFDAPVKHGHQEITIMCAVFDDRSSEGDYAWAQATFDRRAGYIRGFKKINSLIQAAGENPDVGALRDAVANLPEDSPNSEINSGEHGAKSVTLHALDPIAEWHREGGKGKRQIAMLGREFTSTHEALTSLLKQNQLALEHLLRQEGGKQK